MRRVTPLKMWSLSTSYVKSKFFKCNVKSDYSPYQKWRVTPLHIKCEEWLLSTANIKGDSTSYVKSDSSTSDVKSDSSPFEICRVTPLYIKCEGWLLSTSNVTSDYSQRLIWTVCDEWLLPSSNVKRVSSPHQTWSDSSPPQMLRETPLHIKYEECDSSPHEMWRVTPNVKSDSTSNKKSDSSSHHKSEFPPHQMKKWLLSTSNVKNDPSPL
jgi:hypothetical protein